MFKIKDCATKIKPRLNRVFSLHNLWVALAYQVSLALALPMKTHISALPAHPNVQKNLKKGRRKNQNVHKNLKKGRRRKGLTGGRFLVSISGFHPEMVSAEIFLIPLSITYERVLSLGPNYNGASNLIVFVHIKHISVLSFWIVGQYFLCQFFYF